MAAAVERLLRAREHNEPLVIFGDYDVDGVTSTALLLEVLRPLGWKVDPTCPIAWMKATASAWKRWRIASKGTRSHCCWRWTAAPPRSLPSGPALSAAWKSSSWTITRFRSRRPPRSPWSTRNSQRSTPCPVKLERRPANLRPPSPNSAPPASPSNWPTPSSSAGARSACPARRNSTCGPCSIWLRWAPLPTSSR